MSTPRPRLLPAALALLAAACAPTIPKGEDGGADGAQDGGAGGEDGAGDGAADGSGDGADGGADGGADPDAPWVRDEELSPGPVVFTELHVHPPEGDGAEWLELHNPTVLPIDLSGWALVDGVDYSFPEGTLIDPGGYVVVAAAPAALDGLAAGPVLGPWSGRLANDGEEVELRSNGGRRIDAMRYGNDAPWPVAPGGSGLTLAKARPTDPSARAESWGASAAVGGSPGAENGGPGADAGAWLGLVSSGAAWRVEASGGAPAAGWDAPGFDDGAWAEGRAPFRGAAVGIAPGIATATADNFFALYLGAADGRGLRLVGADPDGDWTTPEDLLVEVGPDEHLFVAAWEAPGDPGGPQMVIAQVEVEDGVAVSALDAWEWVVGPAGANPGGAGGLAPDALDVEALVLDADAEGAWAPPGVELPPDGGPWGWALAWAFDPAARYVWADTFDDLSITNTDETYALYRSVDPIRSAGDATLIDPVPLAAYFRTTFVVEPEGVADRLALDCQIDAGARITLNGVELARDNLPAGALGPETPALVDRGGPTRLQISAPAAALRVGENVLAAEVHQAADGDGRLRFACALSGRPAAAAAPARPPLHLSEWGGAGEGWVELEALADVDPADLRLRSDRGRDLPLPAGALGAGALLLVDGLDDLAAGELLWLADAASGAVLDAARVAVGPRARLAPFGPALTPTVATPGGPNAVELNEDVVIHEVMYHRNPRLEEGLPVEERAEEWIELHNRGEAPVDLGGWRLIDAVGFTFPADTVLAPGGLLVVARDAAGLAALHPDAWVLGDWTGSLSNGGEQIVLIDALGNPADQVRYADGGRWPTAADGGGSSLELIDPGADNGAPGAWAASDESDAAPWTTLRWTAEAAPSAVGPDGVWNELIIGLLDAGEVLIDDVSVVEDPDGEALQLVRDPGFDGAADWRTIGNHRRSARVPDPEAPADTVLRLVATGPTEHMHNHAETTLDQPLRGVRTAVSMRARWVSGSNQLHSRLYFNRMPRTHLLPQPATAGTPGAPNSRAGALGPTLVGLRADRAVPAPGEEVTITVQAADPDGVSAVRLVWRLDGADTFASTDMDEAAPGVYTATVPGQAAGALVQLFVEAEDAGGATSAAPAAAEESRALIQWAGADAAPGALPTLRLLMTAADSALFHDPVNLMSNEGVGATVVYAEQEVYFDVSVRAKGSQRGRPEPLRLGYGLRFLDDAPFRGVHTTVLLDRSEGVNFGQREVLHNIVAARLGLESAELNDLAWVVAPRPEHTGPVELQLDRFGGLMLDAQFEDGGEGTQWDYELIYFPYTTVDGTPEGAKLPQPDAVIGVPISYLGEDKEAYRWNFAIQNNTARDEYDELIGLGELFSSDDATLLSRADEVIDVEQWLRAFAFATLSGAVDNYGSDGAQHNARFYLRPADRRVLYFPHDLDFYGYEAMPVVGNGDLARLLLDSLYHRRYYAALDDALRRAYSSAYLAPWCARLAALLPDQDFDGHCAFVDARAGWLRAGAGDAVDALYPPAPFAITTGGGRTVEVTTPTVTLEGTGGVSVRVIREDSAGFSAEPDWTGPTTWSLTLPVPTGRSALRLVATDLRGAVLGEDSVEVLRAEP
jgi:hypothetical protein